MIRFTARQTKPASVSTYSMIDVLYETLSTSIGA